jgi:hypothetical protein
LHEPYVHNEPTEEEVPIMVVQAKEPTPTGAVSPYANSQNLIASHDFASNDEIQKSIRNALLVYQYFYEIRQGEFDHRYKTVDKKKGAFGIDYMERVVTTETASRAYLAMFKSRPAEAKKLKRKTFLKPEEGFYREIFGQPKPVLPERVLAAWKLLGYIEKKRNEYRGEYRAAAKMPTKERDRIYKFDFVLYSEYFFLNLLVDFLEHKGLDLRKNKAANLSLVRLVDSNDIILEQAYDEIRRRFAAFISLKRKRKTYTHKGFFESEGSLSEVRAYFHSRYRFVREA